MVNPAADQMMTEHEVAVAMTDSVSDHDGCRCLAIAFDLPSKVS